MQRKVIMAAALAGLGLAGSAFGLHLGWLKDHFTALLDLGQGILCREICPGFLHKHLAGRHPSISTHCQIIATRRARIAVW